jgi:WD40 repeat protein
VFIPKQREADQLAQQDSDGRILLPGDADWERYRALIEVRESLDGLELQRRELEAEFKITIGPADGLEGIATWRTQSFLRFDQDSLRSTQPDVYRLFLVEERRSGGELAVLRGHESAVMSAVYSPDGSRILTVSSDTVRVWEHLTVEQLLERAKSPIFRPPLTREERLEYGLPAEPAAARP